VVGAVRRAEDRVNNAATPGAPFTFVAFRLLFAGRFFAGIATAIAPVALAFAVLDLGGSPTDLGLVLAARTVPLVLLLLLGGVIADRFQRHRVVVVCNLVSVLTQASVAALLFTGGADLWLIASIEAVNGAASAFLFPAVSGIASQTVPPHLLQQANAALRLGTNGALIVGAAAGGGLIAAVGPSWGFTADAVCYLLSALLVWRMRLPVTSPREPGSSVLTEMREGWTEFRGRTWVWALVLQFAFVNMAFTAAVATLGPVIADQTPGIGRAGWGAILATQTVGMVTGGFIALRGGWNRPLLVASSVALLEVPFLLLLGVHPSLLPLMLAAFVSGISFEIFGVAWDVALQSNVPEERLSRVYAYDWFGSVAFTPVGQTLAGPLAMLVGLTVAPVICAGITLVAVLAVLSSSSVRNVRRHAPQEPLRA
jgi:MFS family permease